MTTTFKNHAEFINWGSGVCVGESCGCWEWVEGRISEKGDKFYWFARCFGASYSGPDALPFGEAEWAKTMSHLKSVYQYYFGEEMPNGLNATHPNHALVLDAFNAITCEAQWCEECGDWRMWGDECAECEKVQVGLRSGVYLPAEESEETKEGDQCECGEKFCRCDEGSHSSMDDWECCEMCGDKTNNGEWFDEEGTGILYCSPCENRMLDRREARAKEEQKAKEEKEWEQEILAVCENRMKEENEKKAKEQKEAFNRTQSWWGHRMSRDDCGVKVIYDPETEGWLTAEDSCRNCGCVWDCCECEDTDDEPELIPCEATEEQIEEAEEEYHTYFQEYLKRRFVKLEGGDVEAKLDVEVIKKLTEAEDEKEKDWTWDDVREFIDGINCDEEPVE